MLPQVEALQGKEQEDEQIQIISGKNPECAAGEKSDRHFPDRHGFVQRFLFGIKQDACNQVTA